MFSCALAPPIVTGVSEALRIAIAEPELRTKLWHNVTAMREALLEHNVDIGTSTSQVIPIMVRNDKAIFEIARALEAAGVYLNPILFPAIKQKQSRFRVSVSAAHEPDELRAVAKLIAQVLKTHKVIK
jgi:glycine C-acetyltransferase